MGAGEQGQGRGRSRHEGTGLRWQSGEGGGLEGSWAFFLEGQKGQGSWGTRSRGHVATGPLDAGWTGDPVFGGGHIGAARAQLCEAGGEAAQERERLVLQVGRERQVKGEMGSRGPESEGCGLRTREVVTAVVTGLLSTILD